MVADPPPPFLWVALSARDICVWPIAGNEQREAEYFDGLGVEPGSPEWAALPLTEHLFHQFRVSCHAGPPPHGDRVFAGLGALAIDQLHWREKHAISAAIAALNVPPDWHEGETDDCD